MEKFRRWKSAEVNMTGSRPDAFDDALSGEKRSRNECGVNVNNRESSYFRNECVGSDQSIVRVCQTIVKARLALKENKCCMTHGSADPPLVSRRSKFTIGFSSRYLDHRTINRPGEER